MTRLDRFNKNKENINLKYDYIELIDNRDYFKFKEKVEWKCTRHNYIFNASMHLLLDKAVTCGCPICKHEKLIESSLKGVQRRKELRGE